jgi:hypothetical protein
VRTTHKLSAAWSRAEGEAERLPLEPLNLTKEKKTAEGLAAKIHEDLSKMDDCSQRGVIITVYGLNPWNSMLTFSVAAGPVPNKAELQNFCEIYHRAAPALVRRSDLSRAAFSLHAR